MTVAGPFNPSAPAAPRPRAPTHSSDHRLTAPPLSKTGTPAASSPARRPAPVPQRTCPIRAAPAAPTPHSASDVPNLPKDRARRDKLHPSVRSTPRRGSRRAYSRGGTALPAQRASSCEASPLPNQHPHPAGCPRP